MPGPATPEVLHRHDLSVGDSAKELVATLESGVLHRNDLGTLFGIVVSFPTQPQVNGQIGLNLPVILEKHPLAPVQIVGIVAGWEPRSRIESDISLLVRPVVQKIVNVEETKRWPIENTCEVR